MKRNSIRLLILSFWLAALFLGACSSGSGISSNSSSSSEDTGYFTSPRYQETDYLYDDTRVRKIEISIDPAVFSNVVWDQYLIDDDKMYALADSFKMDGEEVLNIGIRSRGNTSIDNNKRQFKLSFDCTQAFTNSNPDAFVAQLEYDDRRFHGTKKLNLRASQNDPTIIREKIASLLFQHIGAYAPRVGFTELYINDEYWGLYLTVEQIDKTFLDSRMEEKSGNLYKGVWGAAGAILQSGHESAFELKTNKTENDTSDLSAFFAALGSASTENELSALLDLDNVIRYQAAAVLAGHWDSYLWCQNNDYLYHHADNKFRIIVWDMDNTFGSGIGWGFNVMDSSIYMMADKENYQTLFKKVMALPEWKSKYEGYVREILSNCMDISILGPKIDAWKALIETSVLADNRKNQDWDVDSSTGDTIWEEGFTQQPGSWNGGGFGSYTGGLKGWIQDRVNTVRSELGMPTISSNTVLQEVSLTLVITNAHINGTPIGSSNYEKTGVTGNVTWLSESGTTTYKLDDAKTPASYSDNNNGSLSFTYTVPAGEPTFTKNKLVVKYSSDFASFGTSNGWENNSSHEFYLAADQPVQTITRGFMGFQ